ncbi:MAG: hypothetical protein H7A25_05815 [Leptospiraceae bacterium]|nr:hypothetical protein [Leptospiraceae bacterium]MCP5499398.1 hypothetical protein [Leptospiraceae bacterium]
MNPIISSPGSEYVCPSCGRKSRLPQDIPKHGIFKVACFYCKHISEVKFETRDEEDLEQQEAMDLMQPEEERDSLDPLAEMGDPFEEKKQEISRNPLPLESDVEELEPDLYHEIPEFEPDLNITAKDRDDFENPIDNPVSLEEDFEPEPENFEPIREKENHTENSSFFLSGSEDDYNIMDKNASEVEALQTDKENSFEKEPEPVSEKKVEEKNLQELPEPSMQLIPYKKKEFSNKIVGKIAHALDINKISVEGNQYVPIVEKVVRKVP